MTNFKCLNKTTLTNYKKIGLSFLFALFNSMNIFSQDVSAKTDTTNIRIGEHFFYEIFVSDSTNVVLPKLEKLQGLEIIEDQKTDTVKNQLFKKYIMTGFDSGAYYIPSQQVFIRGRAYFTDSILINVATVKVDTVKQPIFEIKSIQSEPYVFDDFKPYIKWILLGLLLIGFFVYFIITRKKRDYTEKEEIVEALPPIETAINKLKQLDEKLLWQNNQVKEYYSELTEIVRDYIEKEIKIPALEITTDELLNYLKDCLIAETIDTNDETIKKLKALLEESDLVKFAKSKPLSHEIEEDRRGAETIIQQLKIKSVIQETVKEDDELE